MISETRRGTIGERITDSREAKGMTARGLAQRLGVKPATVDGWEQDRAAPRANKLAMIAGVLDVPLMWLLEGGSKYEPTSSRGSRVDAVAQKLERVVRMQDEIARLIAEISIEVDEIRRIEAELDELAA